MTATDPEIPLKPRLAQPPKALLSSTSHLLKRLGWVIKERSAGAFQSTGLSPYHYAVLALLDEEPRETQAMIADALGYDRSHLVGLLDELEDRGLIERQRDPADRRRHLVTLTSDGRTALNKLRSVVKSIEDDFLAPLDAEQREALHTVLLLLAGYHEPRYAASDRTDA
jgi:DNA-binding MarR family transcriptional regulator